eukprot:CAMPEP_0204837730 /NCGR_PEP_ID=MMETSP1346-20131115/28846_1 /ASSEMBLY_ACC=CAM_ASM_000771 /TAXON_ID=215587 /ORGANISM="Aplanochytrium stocchinoi, Strain GSBS06" /LENGTH=45 /DNA_ID= /DNA_START= /DNA_END= /DNA_ORIENTATION=
MTDVRFGMPNALASRRLLLTLSLEYSSFKSRQTLTWNVFATDPNL